MGHDYGLKKDENSSVQPILLRHSNKRFIMTNLREVGKRVTVKKVEKKLKTLKFREVETKVATLLVQAIFVAILKKQDTVDLTDVFNYEYVLHAGGEFFPKEPVQAVLMEKVFKKVDETENEILVKMNL